MSKINLILLIVISFVFVSCKENPENYVNYYKPLDRVVTDKRDYAIKTLAVDGDIDILWVIDNSGSMMDIQNNVIANAKIFMQEFAKQKYINWKMGIISTDEDEVPFLGFSSIFDYTLVDHTDPTSLDRVVDQFQAAVRSLGTNGSPTELTFYNILRIIQEYNGPQSTQIPYLRRNAHLAVIMVTDEEEQSMDEYGGQYDAFAFLNSLKAFIGQGREIRFYGALKKDDLPSCKSGWSSGNYKGSQFEKIIVETGGFNISACVPNFGTKLVEISKDIASMIKLPSILLGQRPKVHTLKIYYRGKEIKAGKPDNGGYWFYSETFNTINFYSLDFVVDINKDTFEIVFDIDDGHIRDGDPVPFN